MGLKNNEIDRGTDGARELARRQNPLWHVNEHESMDKSLSGQESKSAIKGPSGQSSAHEENNDTSNQQSIQSIDNRTPNIPQELVEEMRTNGVKFRPDELIFVTRDTSGQIVWLAPGNSGAGLTHIMKHASDFHKALGIPSGDIPKILRNIMSKGKIVKVTTEKLSNGFKRITKTFEYNDQFYVVIGVGDNGFIVTAFPRNKTEEE